ncbi:MAG: CoA-acylating methylmalonate-semialdehyde dehydrogenase [Candidatus Endonucleobacter bathymodioli]|uniref:methylmalonate-semialdehyde dehydrogenase (CoA acylating) n=1 Tax=Candidatus Endonucleibacter bathymodioli TaxID=539814 RepID=A0AA90NKX4_9GAMM|nr:CoA-acylating methylmalonate-semialdehyde dehydrogenase [Candidatus Endonucleobacter bathymodioli]
MTKQISHFIAGKLTEPSKQQDPIFNPATGEQSGTVSLASQAETEHAIITAKEAFSHWRQVTPLNRARILFKFKALIEQHRDELAELITHEHGKIFDDARGEVTRGMEVVEFACGAPHLLKGEHTENIGTGIDAWSINQPLGVVTGITPFNFPAMVPLWMFPIAIACGNTFILKPSEKTPSASLYLARLFKESGLPDGVLNVINGNKEAVDTLLKSPDIQAASFVGSTPVAEYVYQVASHTGKRVQALGGAKNHMVIMPDADLDQTVNALLGAAYGSAGERCMAISVAVAVADVADRLIEKLTPKIRDLRIGPGMNTDIEIGPLISKSHRSKVKDYIDSGVAQGATLVIDGRKINVHDHENGYYLGGTLFDNVTTDMSIYREEIFGPVLCVVRVPNYQTATKIINDHEYGNGTTIFTRDGDSARQFAHDIQVGMVGINVPIPVPMAFHSFGGWKRSLFGPLHMHGTDAVRFYTRRKAITARWPKGIRDNTEFTLPTMT